MAGDLKPRVFKAGNRGPFTLDGTRSFVVGKKRAVVIDPGPNVEEHVRALSFALSEAEDVRLLLTHGHGDHAGAAASLSAALGAPVFGHSSRDGPGLADGQRIPTDEGELVAISTPGHTKDHIGFFWPRAAALFAGDLVLGRGATTWLGEYQGCVADYLASLDRVKELAPGIIYPAHGPPLRSPDKTLDVYRAHRMLRLDQVSEIRRANPEASVGEFVRAVYGPEIPDRLAKAARSSIEVMLFHLESSSRKAGESAGP